MDACAASSPAPKISVVVPVYNVEKYLPECVESVLAQTFADFELILVDDGSPDRSGELCDAFAKKDPRIRVFHKPNGGVSSARNFGVKNARAGYVAFLDSDDWWSPLFLEKMVALSKKYPHAACCCCCWYNSVRSVEKNCAMDTPSTLAEPNFPHGEMRFFDVVGYASEKGRLPIWTGAVLVKKEAFDAVGGFHEDLVFYEDYSLWFRLCMRNGGNAAYLNEPLAFYRIDSPVENKPRGKHPDLAGHWVAHLKRDLPSSGENKNMQKFIDRFRLMSLLRYRRDKKHTMRVREILSEVQPSHWTFRYALAYKLPPSAGDLLINIYSWIKRK